MLKQLGMTLLSFTLIGYLVLQLSLNVGDIIEFEYVTYATATEKEEIKAYIFRDEVIINAATLGTNSFLVDDGEKVSKGEQVAITYSNSSDASVQRSIREINQKISVLEKSAISTGTSTTDSNKLDNNIDNIIIKIRRAVDDNDLEKALRYKNELAIQSNRRQALFLDKTNYGTEINQLKRQKALLEASLKGEKTVHLALKSGYFYSTVDGYENVFTMNKLNSLTISDYDTLSQSVPDRNNVNNAVGKLIVRADWFMACEVDKRTASSYSEGFLYSFSFPYSSGIVLDMKLLRKIRQTDLDRVILVFTSNSIPEGFNYTRAQKVERIKNIYEGIKIPVSAIRINNNETGVYAIARNKVIFKKATVLYEENGYCICALPTDPKYPTRKKSNLSLYDAVICSGRNLYEGKILQ